MSQDIVDQALAERLGKALETLQTDLVGLEMRLQSVVQEHGPEALYWSGEWLLSHGRTSLALACLTRAALALPEDLLTAHNHAEALRQLGRLEPAALEFQRAIGLQFDFMPARQALVDVLEKTILQMRAAGYAALADEQAAGLSHLLNETACLLLDQGQGYLAWDLYKRALVHTPRFTPALSNLGNILRMEGQLAESEKHCRQALEIDPNMASAWCNLGNVLADRGRREQADACFDRALQIDPKLTIADHNKRSGTLFNALHSSRLSDAEVFEQHLEWGRAYEGVAAEHAKLAWQPGEPIRVGYLSADFRAHAMRHYLEPLLAGHDRERVHVICYMQSNVVDILTHRLQSYGHEWVDVHAMDDNALVKRIRDDKVHILVDCMGHTLGTRLTALARKPAPVQMGYLGYLGSTGLPAMDYRLSDSWMDPVGLTENQHSEQLLRIQGGSVAYAPHMDSPDVNALPALTQAGVTFGSLNKLEKINLRVIQVWADILKQLPGSRLLLKTKQLADHMAAGRILGLFEAQGIEEDRLVLRPASPGHLSTYHEIDIALDPFPFGGGATTCDALWMGVPVITMPGTRSASRLTHSILNTMGRGQWSTTSFNAYVEKAVNMANDLTALAQVRSTLREEMQVSPLINAKDFVRRLEDVYAQVMLTLNTR
jgi:protein O-GlcNAc transferase